MATPARDIIPRTEQSIREAEQRCRELVKQRAVWSAGVSAIPLPAIDLATDVGLFRGLINDINTEFGLTPQQIGKLQPKMRQYAFEALAAFGGALAGKVVSNRLLRYIIGRTIKKQITRQIAKYVPFAGQIVSAAVGYTAFRAIGNQHIDACVQVAKEMMRKGGSTAAA